MLGYLSDLSDCIKTNQIKKNLKFLLKKFETKKNTSHETAMSTDAAVDVLNGFIGKIQQDFDHLYPPDSRLTQPLSLTILSEDGSFFNAESIWFYGKRSPEHQTLQSLLWNTLRSDMNMSRDAAQIHCECICARISELRDDIEMVQDAESEEKICWTIVVEYFRDMGLLGPENQ